MATSRPFAYNPIPPGSEISGTTQFVNLAIGVLNEQYDEDYGGVKWWEGPDEDLGYIICQPMSGNTQPTPISGLTASVGFYRTTAFTDSAFLLLCNKLPARKNQVKFQTTNEATVWLTANGYWTNYVAPTPTPTLTPTQTPTSNPTCFIYTLTYTGPATGGASGISCCVGDYNTGMLSNGESVNGIISSDPYTNLPYFVPSNILPYNCISPTPTYTPTGTPASVTPTPTSTPAGIQATIAFSFFDDGSGVIRASMEVVSGVTLDSLSWGGDGIGYSALGCIGTTNIQSFSDVLGIGGTQVTTEVWGAISAILSANLSTFSVAGNTINTNFQTIVVGGNSYLITGATDCFSPLT